jgi:hypothetical protein
VTRRDLHRLERAEARARGVSVERLRAMGREALREIVGAHHTTVDATQPTVDKH